VTGDLRYHGGDVRVQFEISSLDEKAADPPEIDRGKEILEVEVENVPTVAMLSRVGDD